MTKKGKFNGVVKGAVMGVSLMLCMSALPVGAIVSFADTVSQEQKAATTNQIELDANVKTADESKLNEKVGKVTKGNRYYIPTAKFNDRDISVSSDKDSITVRYKNSNMATDLIKDADNNMYYFEASTVGTYVVSYTVKEGTKTYSYDYEVECEVSEVHFEFATNSEDIIPSIYDISLLNSKAETKNKNIVLPIPTVKDENDEVVKFAEGNISTAKKNTSDSQLVISLSTGVNNVKIEEKEGKFVISGEALSKKEGNKYVAAGVYKINYTLYQNGVFVSQTTKQFEVKENHYMKESNKSQSGYTLSVDYASSVPTSAVTGVMKELPKVTARATESTENDSVDAYYTIKVFHLEDGEYKDRTEECLNKDNQLEFTAFEDGNYRIEYEVKDFYKNTAKPKNYIYLSDVKDTKAPTVYAFNGDTKNNEGEKGDDFAYRIKYRQSIRNLIVYAIGAEDNVQNENMVLVREIRDAASNITRVKIEDYNDKNLIFLPKAATEGTSVYEQIFADNYYLGQDMLKGDDKISSATDSEGIKTWLKGHNYLIVTKDFNINPITGEKFASDYYAGIVTDPTSKQFDLKKIKDKLAEDGFAYVSYTDYTFSQQQYNIHYSATDDAKNDTKDVYYSVYLSSDNAFSDQEAPSFEYSTGISDTVLPTDKLEFKAPAFKNGFTDSQDERLKLVFAYRYLSSSNTALTNTETKTIAFTNKRVETGAKDWFNKDLQVTSNGWFMLDETNSNGMFDIDLEKDLAKANLGGAQYLEIFGYVEDDYGNLGFHSEIINIAQQTENSELKLLEIIEDVNNSLVANSTITLPTISYTDKFVQYMTADVTVYYMPDESTKSKVQSYDMSTEADRITQTFTIEAGKFVVSRAGNYQVVITARDAGGMEHITFFDYEISSNGQVEDPAVDNISASTVNLKIGEQYALPTPTVAISDSSDYDYFGISKRGSVNMATYYTTKMISATNNDYKLTQNHFTPRSSGEYSLNYEVKLIRYNKKDNFAEEATDGKLSMQGDNLVYTKGTTTYYVYFKKGTEDIVVSTSLNKADSTNSLTVTNDKKTAKFEGITLDKFVFETEPQTFKVSEISSPVITVDEDLFSLSNVKYDETLKYNKIEIPNISATVDGTGSLDFSKSKIEISVARGIGTTILQTIDCDKISEVNSDNIKYDANEKKLYLLLRFDGTYSIKYTAQAQNNIGEAVADPSSKTFTIENGDIQRPTITVGDSFLNRGADEYSLENNDLILDVSALTFKDNESGEDYLKAHYSIVVRNATTHNSVTRVGDGDTYNYTLETAGEYEIVISVTDVAGWTTEKTVTIKVVSEEQENNEVYKVVGTVLIVISVVVLAGVVTYFIVSKVKQDKKSKKTR